MPKLTPIQKLSKLSTPESFMQINTIQGFTYIDRAGEIVNRYVTDDSTIPEVNMGLTGMMIPHPTPKIEALQVTPIVVWTKFTTIDSLDQISHLFLQEAQAILKILGV